MLRKSRKNHPIFAANQPQEWRLHGIQPRGVVAFRQRRADSKVRVHPDRAVIHIRIEVVIVPRQELLRHSSLRSTLDICTQAIMPAKHAAQRAVLSLVFSPEENLSSSLEAPTPA